MGSDLGPARGLWMATMPLLTEGVVLAELRAAGLLLPAGGARVSEIAVPGSLISTEQWLGLRNRCAYRVGIDDFNGAELAQLLSGRSGDRWREELRRREAERESRAEGIEGRISRAIARLERE